MAAMLFKTYTMVGGNSISLNSLILKRLKTLFTKEMLRLQATFGYMTRIVWMRGRQVNGFHNVKEIMRRSRI